MRNPEWKIALLTAREKWMKEHYAACRDFGVPVKIYSDKTANGLTNCITDFLKYNGHYANRINTTGTMRKIKGEMKWTKGTTRKGAADIDSIIDGKPVKIEVKIGRDKMSEAQEKEQRRITAAGGVYLIAKDMEGFYNWYKSWYSNAHRTNMSTGNSNDQEAEHDKSQQDNFMLGLASDVIAVKRFLNDDPNWMAI